MIRGFTRTASCQRQSSAFARQSKDLGTLRNAEASPRLRGIIDYTQLHRSVSSSPSSERVRRGGAGMLPGLNYITFAGTTDMAST